MDGWIAPEPQGPLDPYSEAEAPPSASVAILPNTNCSRELCDQSLFDFNRSLILSLNDHVPLQTSVIRHATCRKFEVTQGKLSAHPHWLSPSKPEAPGRKWNRSRHRHQCLLSLSDPFCDTPKRGGPRVWSTTALVGLDARASCIGGHVARTTVP